MEGPAGPEVRHPIFARLYAGLFSRGLEAHRVELLAGLRGTVIEVGAGNGRNFPHYPPEVRRVLAVEPEPYLRGQAMAAARSAPVPVQVAAGPAERLPAPDGSFDAGVASLVLCSVGSLEGALAELWRVIRPGGELRFYEHVRARRRSFAAYQAAADVIWPRLFGNCHTGRDTPAAIAAAGFRVEEVRELAIGMVGPLGVPAAPHVIGRARRPA